jgi:hypothetical protein
MKNIVVARVNGVDVTMDALVKMMNMFEAGSQDAPESREEIRKMALEQVVLRELALQEAARQGLRVEEGDLNQAMERLKLGLGHDEGFQRFLEKQNVTEQEVRAQVERGLLLRLLFKQEVIKKAAPVSDDDVRTEYESRKEQYAAEGKTSFEEAKGPIEKKLRAEAQTKRRQEWEQELKKDAKIEIMEP